MNVLNRTLRHDLRNAMNVILGNAELLMREYGSDDRAETVRSTAANMLELSNKVREIEHALDTSDRPREMVDVVSVVEEYVSAVRRSRPDVTIEVDLPESEWVLANNRIGAAIDNAIENAIDHNPSEEPRLRITAEAAEIAGDDAVTITVADDGPGIPDEELAVLTEGGETPLEHTSGIGLWLIKWIVTESAGEVSFENSEMGGTAVRITLQTARVGQRIDVG
jgi:signal transduction histidine kinase